MKTLNIILTIAIVALTLNCFAGNNDKMAGTYTIGKNPGASFNTISAALTALETNGSAGAVTFVVDKDTYDQQVIIAAIVKTSAAGNVAFVNADDQSNTASISDDNAIVASK